MYKRKELACPYRDIDLLTTSKFISFCKERGVNVGKTELEFYDKIGLLLPVVGVYSGYSTFNKIKIKGEEDWKFVYKGDLEKFDYDEKDPQDYYQYSGLIYGKRGWLEWYEENGLTYYPHKNRYRTWENLQSKQVGFLPERLKKDYRLFYNKYQIIALKHLQKNFTVKVTGQMMFAEGDEKWIKFGKNMNTIAKVKRKHVGEIITRFHDELKFINEILDLQYHIHSTALEDFQWLLENDFTQEDAKESYKNTLKDESTKAEATARALMENYNFDLVTVREMRDKYFNHGYWFDDTTKLYLEMESVADSFRKKAKGDLKFSQFSYETAEIISWFLALLGDPLKTRKKFLTGFEDKKLCPYCKRLFVPFRPSDQISCGEEECENAHRNAQKRRRRSLSKSKKK